MCLCVSARARRNADNGGPFDPTGEGICYNFRYKIYLKYNTICKTLYIYIYIYIYTVRGAVCGRDGDDGGPIDPADGDGVGGVGQPQRGPLPRLHALLQVCLCV